jgi:hypothetical protein
MSNLIPIEHKSQRVLTTQQIAESYETSTDNISKNYTRNMDRYHLGIHFFILEGEELKAFKASGQIDGLPANANRIFLWTERGAFHHAKSLNTDKAWELYDKLVGTYFASVELKQHIDSEKLSPQTQLLLQLSQSIARSELEQQRIEQIALEAKSGLDQARETISNIKDTMAELPKDQWRKWINTSLGEIGIHLGNKGQNHEDLRSDSYKLLEERAGADLAARVRNGRKRLEDAGATKTAVENYRKIDAIEEDKRLKEIYTGIVRELRIKHLD